MLFRLTRQLAILFFVISLASCIPTFEDSPSTLLKEVYNHKKTKKAMLFMNSGNATTDNSLHVFVENPDFELTDTELGNVFIVDSDHNSAKLDSNAINLTWSSEETLEILYNSKLRTFKKASEVNGVWIVYKEVLK